MSEQLVSTVDLLSKRISSGSFRTRVETSHGVVQRVLHDLGWPVFDTHVVAPEFSIGSRTVDYALCHPPYEPSVLVDVREPERVDRDAETQVLEYCHFQEVPVAVLTDGRIWDFFFPIEKGGYEERRVGRLDLVEDENTHAARTLTNYLQYESVTTGRARERAEKDYRVARFQQDAMVKYAPVWKRLLEAPDPLLLDLFSEEVETATGVWPDPDLAAAFIRSKVKSGTSSVEYLDEAVATSEPETGTVRISPSKSRGKKGMPEREQLRYRFFEGLLEHAKSITRLHGNISPGKESWVAAGGGISGVTFNYVVRQHDARIELYIDTLDGGKNQRIFGTLFGKKETIEGTFGLPLEWDPKEGRRACGVRKTYAIGGYRDEDAWQAVYEELSQGMAKFETALKPHLA